MYNVHITAFDWRIIWIEFDVKLTGRVVLFFTQQRDIRSATVGLVINNVYQKVNH